LSKERCLRIFALGYFLKGFDSLWRERKERCLRIFALGYFLEGL
jgi:hypothetical protein